MRLSVEVEYVAYIYDCLHEAEQSRRRAKAAIRAVYEAQEGMDDESFVDASELVSMYVYCCCSFFHLPFSIPRSQLPPFV